MSTIIEKIEEARQFLVSQACDAPEFGLILGSGLGELAEEIENAVVIPYEKIPNWVNQQLLVTLVDWFMVTLVVTKFLLFKDVSISTKEIQWNW